MAVAGVEALVPASFGGYRRGQELGRGASGMVFACNRTLDNQKFAVKAIDLRRLRLSAKAEREQKKLEREVAILKKVPPHPRLVRFVDALEEGTWFFLVLEFVPGGDLFNNLIARPALPGKRPCFKEAETAHVLNQLVEGLEFLHQHDVIHRDLKLENILVVRERKQPKPPNYILCDVKITDFGLSKIVGDGLSQAHSTVGSPRYIAPEVLARGVHDFRADVWSLGVLLHVLLAGRFPVDGPNNVSQQAIDASIGRLEASQGARNVVLGLLQVEREKRLSLAEVRDHPWLTATSPSLDTVYPVRGSSISVDASPVSSHPTISLFGSEDDDDDDDGVEMIVQDPGRSSSSRSRSKGDSFADLIVEVSADVPSIAGLDTAGVGSAVKGLVAYRSDFKTGNGFLLRLHDESGDIDVKFWDGAASRFKAETAFSKGYLLLLEGFQMVRLKEKEKQFAPPGRTHCLSYNAPDAVRFTMIEAPKAPKKIAARRPQSSEKQRGEGEAVAKAIVTALRNTPKAIPPHVLMAEGQSPRTKNLANNVAAAKAEAVLKNSKSAVPVAPRRASTTTAATTATTTTTTTRATSTTATKSESHQKNVGSSKDQSTAEAAVPEEVEVEVEDPARRRSAGASESASAAGTSASSSAATPTKRASKAAAASPPAAAAAAASPPPRKVPRRILPKHPTAASSQLASLPSAPVSKTIANAPKAAGEAGAEATTEATAEATTEPARKAEEEGGGESPKLEVPAPGPPATPSMSPPPTPEPEMVPATTTLPSSSPPKTDLTDPSPSRGAKRPHNSSNNNNSINDNSDDSKDVDEDDGDESTVEPGLYTKTSGKNGSPKRGKASEQVPFSEPGEPPNKKKK